jgi:hypothetical protein
MPAALHGKTRFSVGRKGGQKEGEGRMARIGGDESRPGAGLGCPAYVAMVQATNFGNLHDLTHLWPLDRPHIRRILLEPQVSSCPMVVHEVAGQDAVQVAFAQDEDMIQTLA